MSFYKPMMFSKRELGEIIIKNRMIKSLNFDIFQHYKKNLYSLKVRMEDMPFFLYDGYWQDRILVQDKKTLDILSGGNKQIKKEILKTAMDENIKNPYKKGEIIINLLKNNGLYELNKLKHFNRFMKKVYIQTLKNKSYNNSFRVRNRIVKNFYKRMAYFAGNDKDKVFKMYKLFIKFINFELNNTLSYELRKLGVKEKYIPKVKNIFIEYVNKDNDLAVILFNKKKIIRKNISNIFQLKNILREIDILFNFSKFSRNYSFSKKEVYSFMFEKFLNDKGLSFNTLLEKGRDSKEYRYLNNLSFFLVLSTFSDKVLRGNVKDELESFLTYLKTYDEFLLKTLDYPLYLHLSTHLLNKIEGIDEIKTDRKLLNDFESLYKKILRDKDIKIGNNYIIRKPLLKYTLTEYVRNLNKVKKEEIYIDNLSFETVAPVSFLTGKNYTLHLKSMGNFNLNEENLKKIREYIKNITSGLDKYDTEFKDYFEKFYEIIKEYQKKDYFISMLVSELQKIKQNGGYEKLLYKTSEILFLSKIKDSGLPKKEKTFFGSLFIFSLIFFNNKYSFNFKHFYLNRLIKLFEERVLVHGNFSAFNKEADELLNVYFDENGITGAKNLTLKDKIKLFADNEKKQSLITSEFTVFKNLYDFMFFEDEYFEFFESFINKEKSDKQDTFSKELKRFFESACRNTVAVKSILIVFADIVKHPENFDKYINKKFFNYFYNVQIENEIKNMKKQLRILKDEIIKYPSKYKKRNLLYEINDFFKFAETALSLKIDKKLIKNINAEVMSGTQGLSKQDYDFIMMFNIFNKNEYPDIVSEIESKAQNTKERLDLKYNTHELLRFVQNQPKYIEAGNLFLPVLSKNRNILLNIAFNDKEKLDIFKYILYTPLNKKDIFYMNITKKEQRFVPAIKRKEDFIYNVFSENRYNSFFKIYNGISKEEVLDMIIRNKGEFKKIFKGRQKSRIIRIKQLFNQIVKENPDFILDMYKTYPYYLSFLINDNGQLSVLNSAILKKEKPYYVFKFDTEEDEYGNIVFTTIASKVYDRNFAVMLEKRGFTVTDDIEKYKRKIKVPFLMFRKNFKRLLNKYQNDFNFADKKKIKDFLEKEKHIIPYGLYKKIMEEVEKTNGNLKFHNSKGPFLLDFKNMKCYINIHNRITDINDVKQSYLFASNVEKEYFITQRRLIKSSYFSAVSYGKFKYREQQSEFNKCQNFINVFYKKIKSI